MKWKLFALLVVGIWIGMLIGISFVEAPLKFRAPNITLVLGLGIGKLVFSALNKFEIVFSIFMAVWLVKEYKSLETATLISLSIPILLVALQSIWLIPILENRADSIIQGMSVPDTNHHLYYVTFEASKLIFLFFGFFKIFDHAGHP